MDNVLFFPSSTIVDKNVPKNAFFGRTNVEQKSTLKQILTREFESITWLYKLAENTLNVSDGDEVHEIDVFVCKMKDKDYKPDSIFLLDEQIPRQTLFVVEYEENIDLLIRYKERIEVRGEAKWKFGKAEILKRFDYSKKSLLLNGMSMDKVYANLLSNISQLNVQTIEEYKDTKAHIAQKETLMKQIATLESKVRKEVQPRKKFELHQQIVRLKKELGII